MGRLEEIREELYRKTPPEPAPKPPEDFKPPAKEREVKGAWESGVLTSPTLLERAYLARWRARRRIFGRTFLFIGAMSLLGVLAFIGYTIFFSRTVVRLEILGPSRVTAGEPAVFTIRIVNKSGVALKDGALTLTLPEGALYGEKPEVSLRPRRERLQIADIPPSGEFKKEIRINFLGAVNESRSVSGLYLYRPENISSKLTRSAEAGVTIVRLPLVVSAEAPEKISSGLEFSMTISVDAQTSSPLPPMTLGIDFPAGFELKSSDPGPSPALGPNLWLLGGLEAGTSTKITLRGAMKGEPAEVKAFRLRLGHYEAASRQWLLLTENTIAPAMASPFLFAQASIGGARGGVIRAGERLEGKVLFKNNLEKRIENLTITLSFPEKFVELETVQAENGFYDVSRRAVTWNPASEPRLRELESGEEGTLDFSFQLKSSPPIRSFSDKNFFFNISAAIDSASPPPEFRGVSLAYQDFIEFKIESRLTLAARAAYYDSPRPNSGPMPPKVRNTTTYTVFLQAGSGANDLRNVEVRAQLPGGVEFGDVLASDIGKIDFNPASREVIWRIGSLSAATGILRPHLAAVFRVALMPAENQVNTSPVLLQNISAGGRDAFADRELNSAAENLTTELRGDAKSNFSEWRVVP